MLTNGGTYQLQASDPDGDAMGDSNKFGIGGDTLKFLIQPKNADPGDPLSTKVEAFTPKGERDTTLTDTVQLSLNVVSGGTNATLSGMTTLALVGGFATFTPADKLSVNASGTYTLGAGALSDGSTDYSVSSGTSDPFSIATDHLVLKPQPPSTVDVLKPIPFVVEEVDGHGKINTDENSATATLSLQSATPGTTALGGTTSAKFSDGIASFTTTDGPTINSPGTYTFVVNESGTASPATQVTTRAIKVKGYSLYYEERASGYTAVAGEYGPPGQFIAADAAVATGNNQLIVLLEDPDGQQSAIPSGATLTVSLTPTSGSGTLASFNQKFNPEEFYTNVDVTAQGSYRLVFTAQFPAGSSIPSLAVAPLTTNPLRFVLPLLRGGAVPTLLAGQDIPYGGNLVFPSYAHYVAVAPSQSTGYLISSSGGQPDANLPANFAYAASDPGSAPKLVIDTPGSYKLTTTAVVTPGGLPFDSSNYTVESDLVPFVVTVRVLPTKLTFVTPPQARIIANSTFSVTVALTDSSGHVLADFDNSPDYNGYAVAVVLSGQSANATAGFVNPTASPVVIVNGVATFSNLSFSQTGVYALHAKLYFANVMAGVSPYQIPDTIDLISELIRVTG